MALGSTQPLTEMSTSSISWGGKAVRFSAYLASGFNLSKTNSHYMYRQFNIQQFYVLPTQCIYLFCVDLITNSDYFPIHEIWEP